MPMTPEYEPKKSATAGLKGLASSAATVAGIALVSWFSDPDTINQVAALIPVKYSLFGGFVLSFITDFARNWLKNKNN